MRYYLEQAIKREASDLHLVSNLAPVVRIHGDIHLLPEPVMTPADLKDLIYGILNEEQRKKIETDWQLCFSLTFEDLGYFRVNIYYHRRRIEAAIRIGSLSMRTFEELGLPTIIGKMVCHPNGILIITGPTGVGKTTTFNSIIDRINRERRTKIVTVEDPIEYIHQNYRSIVIQQEVHTDVKSFGSALVHILRQDPNVIGIGEMRDLDTISTALTAAETGHLVIATLHTNDASRTVNRIIDVFPAHAKAQVRTQLASSLVGIISQQLLPRIDGNGRVLACEVLIATEAVRNVIREDKIQTLPNVILTGQRHGMQLMDKSLLDLYQQGIISYDTAISKVNDPKLFKSGLKVLGQEPLN
ncbi:PilT/PilU family type 4a pilus ATPase [bacterium]|nr:PilT/PilU family type 4a pilus ATPase [candidate division CSSED10-310 bacterium]